MGHQRDPERENRRNQGAGRGNAHVGRRTQVDVGGVRKIEEYRQSDADGDDQPDDAADELPSHTVLRSDPRGLSHVARASSARACEGGGAFERLSRLRHIYDADKCSWSASSIPPPKGKQETTCSLSPPC